MRVFKTIWGLLFRLFPCPARVGLQRIGHPKRDSPVLVTCNFHLTLRRLKRLLGRAGVDAWLLAADSRGVNVWCAAGGGVFDTRSVVSAVKTSGVADLVDHRTLILPPLGAPGIRAAGVRALTGWSVRWGPVRAADLPRYLAGGGERDEGMRRVTYGPRERLDTALGSLFPFYLAGAVGFALFGRGLLLEYLLAGAGTFLFFFLACPWIPGKRGPAKVLFLEALLAAALTAIALLPFEDGGALRAGLIMAMIMFLFFGLELGGLASTMSSELDPFLARLGIGAVGNLALAGTVRTELLNGSRKLEHDPGLCEGCLSCFEVCPQGVWKIGDGGRASLARKEACTACRACLVQCPAGAVRAPPVREESLPPPGP